MDNMDSPNADEPVGFLLGGEIQGAQNEIMLKS